MPCGRLAEMDPRWLAESIVDAAARGSDTEKGQIAWQASHIAQSVRIYVLAEFRGTPVESGMVESIVAGALEALGFSDTALHFALLPPPEKISLLEIALTAGEGFEMGFFHLLGARLKAAASTGTRLIECRGLRESVKSLRGAKHWRADCRALLAEIVGYIRSQSWQAARKQLTIQLL